MTDPRPPKMDTPTEHNGRYWFERKAGAKTWLTGRDTRGQDYGANSGAEATDDVGGELHAFDLNSGQARRFVVATDGVDVTTKTRVA